MGKPTEMAKWQAGDSVETGSFRQGNEGKDLFMGKIGLLIGKKTTQIKGINPSVHFERSET